MLNADDLTQMQSDLADLVGDNQVSIVLRPLSGPNRAAQTVRIVRGGGGRSSHATNTNTGEMTAGVLIVGAATMVVQIGDRFNIGSELYQIDWVRPNRQVRTVAEATVVK